MAHKIACGPLKLTLGGPAGASKFWDDSNPVISSINEVRKSGPLKGFESPQKYDMKGPNDPQQFLLIWTPGYVCVKTEFHLEKTYIMISGRISLLCIRTLIFSFLTISLVSMLVFSFHLS